MKKFKEINDYIKQHDVTIDSLVVMFPKAFVNPFKGEYYLLKEEGNNIRLTYISRKRRLRIERLIRG